MSGENKQAGKRKIVALAVVVCVSLAGYSVFEYLKELGWWRRPVVETTTAAPIARTTLPATRPWTTRPTLARGTTRPMGATTRPWMAARNLDWPPKHEMRTPIRKLEGHTASVRAVRFSADGKTLASAAHDHSVRLWEVATGKAIAKFLGHTGSACYVDFSADGKQLITGAEDATVRIWDIASGEQLWQFDLQPGEVRLAAILPGGKRILIGQHHRSLGSGDISIWDIEEEKRVESYTQQITGAHSAALSPDATIVVAGGCFGGLQAWERESKKPLYRINLGEYGPEGMVFMDGGAKLAVAGIGLPLVVVDPKTGKVLHIPPREGRMRREGFCNSMSISPDGKMMALLDFHELTLVDLATGKYLALIKPSATMSHGVAFSPDGHTLATAGGGMVIENRFEASASNWIELWDVDQAIEQYKLLKKAPQAPSTRPVGNIK